MLKMMSLLPLFLNVRKNWFVFLTTPRKKHNLLKQLKLLKEPKKIATTAPSKQTITKQYLIPIFSKSPILIARKRNSHIIPVGTWIDVNSWCCVLLMAWPGCITSEFLILSPIWQQDVVKEIDPRRSRINNAD